jgi:hypothetical protein
MGTRTRSLPRVRRRCSPTTPGKHCSRKSAPRARRSSRPAACSSSVPAASAARCCSTSRAPGSAVWVSSMPTRWSQQSAPPADLMRCRCRRRRRNSRAPRGRDQPERAGRDVPVASRRGQRAAPGARFDVVVDCSDNFRTKFLINDAAVLAPTSRGVRERLPIRGPAAGLPCRTSATPACAACGRMRPPTASSATAPRPACSGRCRASFGTLQALLALKILLGLRDSSTASCCCWISRISTVKIKAPRRANAARPGCARIHELAREEARHRDCVRSLLDCAAAPASNSSTSAIRRSSRRGPPPARHIPMNALLADPGLLADSATRTGPACSLCCAPPASAASPPRASCTRGASVKSLAGGLRKRSLKRCTSGDALRQQVAGRRHDYLHGDVAPCARGRRAQRRPGISGLSRSIRASPASVRAPSRKATTNTRRWRASERCAS